MDFRGKRLPDGAFVSAFTAEYPSSFASAIIDVIRPRVSQSSCFNQDLSSWRNLLSKNPIAQGPRITDGAGDKSSANWTIPQSKDHFKTLRQKWIKRILHNHLHRRFAEACKAHEPEPFISDAETLQFLQGIANSFPSHTFDFSIPPHQPFRLKLFHSLLLISEHPDADIATLLQEGIPSGAFSKIQRVGLWETNTKVQEDIPELQISKDNWTQREPRPWSYQAADPKETWRWLHRRDPRYQNRRKTMAPCPLIPLSVVWMVDATYQRDNASQTSAIYPSSCLPALH